MKTRTYESAGEDGFCEGTWGYVIELGDCMWFDGGYPTRALARAACNKRVRKIWRES